MEFTLADLRELCKNSKETNIVLYGAKGVSCLYEGCLEDADDFIDYALINFKLEDDTMICRIDYEDFEDGDY